MGKNILNLYWLTHITTKVPLGTLLFPDKPIYSWSNSWHKRCSIQRRLLRSLHVHQQCFFCPLHHSCPVKENSASCRNRLGVCTRTARTNKLSIAQVIWFLLANAKCLRRDCTEISTYKMHQKKEIHHWWSLEQLVVSTSYSPVASSRNLWLVLSSAISGQPKCDRMTDSPFNRYWQTN